MKACLLLLSAMTVQAQSLTRFPPWGPPPADGFPPLPPFPDHPPIPDIPGWFPGMPWRERDCTFDTLNPYSVRATSVRRNDDGSIKDKIVFRFSVVGFPSLRLTHYSHDNETHALTNYRVALFGVSEVDNNTDPVASPNYQSLIGLPLMWSPIEITKTEGENATLYNLSTTRTFWNGMTVRWDTSISTNDALVEDEAWLDPSTVKYSFHVKNFPYKFDTPSYLALVGVVSATEISAVIIGDESSIEAGGSISLGGGTLKWDTWVNADGIAGSIKTEDLDTSSDEEYLDGELSSDDDHLPGEKNKYLAWVIDADKPSEVYWDPVLTINNVDPVTSSTSSLSGGAVAAIVLCVTLSAVVATIVVKKYVIDPKRPDAYQATDAYSTVDVEQQQPSQPHEGSALCKQV
eukprot:TRINITY_DN11378_c0_g1_i3.p1 TRINITY_DN11378_c0_g1~~TRINITY_DN11378_c0_g1_i3.p1  ORF type:complete len:404 (+),score=96.04 TRINITY_DN11378_c0_g1_i3:53-1264(+)